MLGRQLVILSDAHLGAAPPQAEEALLGFLDSVPQLGDCLLINGDLFDFWFSYDRVIPRAGFRAAAALDSLRRRVPIVMVGGNHDRWDRGFWTRDLDIRFEPLAASFEVGARRVLAVHGDGITERHWSGFLLHHVLRHRATIGLFRWIHPDLGYRLADHVTDGPTLIQADPVALDLAAARQQAWAQQKLHDDPSIGLLVMGHTHRPANVELAPGRVYLNPGPWFDGYRYAVANDERVELRRYGGSVEVGATAPAAGPV